MRMGKGRKVLKYLVSGLTVFVLVAVLVFSGCDGGGSIAPDENLSLNEASSYSETIQQEVMKKISEKVLGDVPLKGDYEKIMERGVLRVALPDTKEPYVMVDPEFGIPSGMFPALLSEISNVMILKLNMEVLPEDQYAKLLKGDYSQKYDMYVVLDGEINCPGQINIFYSATSEGSWKSLCIAGEEGDELEVVVGEILTYFNKSGIFARIYERYAEK